MVVWCNGYLRTLCGQRELDSSPRVPADVAEWRENWMRCQKPRFEYQFSVLLAV